MLPASVTRISVELCASKVPVGARSSQICIWGGPLSKFGQQPTFDEVSDLSYKCLHEGRLGSVWYSFSQLTAIRVSLSKQ